MTIKHTVKTLSETDFIYRGKLFKTNRKLPLSHKNRYVVSGKTFSKRTEVKEYIDYLCVNNGVDSLRSDKDVAEIIKEYKNHG